MKLPQPILLGLFYLHVLTVSYYTFYGVSKSLNEYFCLQKRADSPDYTEVLQGNYFNFTVPGSPRDQLLTSLNDTMLLFERGKNDVINMSDFETGGFKSFKDYKIQGVQFKFNYKIDNSYFEHSCAIIKGDENASNELTSNELYSVHNEIVGIDEIGYSSNYMEQISLKVPDGTSTQKRIKCILKKSPETCAMKLSTTNNFFLVYTVLLSISLMLLFSTLFSFKRYFFLRKFHSIINSFNFEKQIRFCNPVTGDPIFIREGELICKLSPTRSVVPGGVIMKKFVDSVGTYMIIKDNLIVKVGDHKEVREINCEQKQIIGEYFLSAFLNPKNCVVNEGETHFLTTLEVLDHLMGGCGLVYINASSPKHILDVKIFEFNLIKKMFDIKDEVASKLLEHNWRFFGDRYNISSLRNCLSGKTWYYNRPDGVGNSQWKRYTSDFKCLMENFGDYKVKCQKVFKETKALQEVKSIDNKLPVKSIKGVVKVAMPEMKESAKDKALEIINPNGHDSFMRDVSSCNDYKYDLVKGFNDYAESSIKFIEELGKFHPDSRVDLKVKKPSEYLEVLKNENKERSKVLKSYRDVLLNPPKTLSKPVQNKITRLNKTASSSKTNEAKKIECETEVEKLKNDKNNWVAPQFECMLLKMKRMNAVGKLIAPTIDIIIYEKLLELLNENEIEEDKGKEEPSAFEFQKSCVMDSIIKDNGFIKQVTYNKGKKNKNKNKGEKRKANLKREVRKLEMPKESLISADFESNFNSAIELARYNLENNLNHEKCFQSNTFKTEKTRNRTFYSLYHAILKYFRNAMKKKSGKSKYRYCEETMNPVRMKINAFNQVIKLKNKEYIDRIKKELDVDEEFDVLISKC